MKRLDIQVLRAVAVSMVVLFHFWPGHFGGGFAGVDVFFVISGFLITSHLVSQKRIQFAAFWARRARRLLPAAFVVILATLVATHVFVSPALIGDYAREATASVFYSENWVLAINSTNYFADGASPYQHYWSLAVEEQFYIFWPLLIALLALARKRMALGIALISLGSFAFAIYETTIQPSFAYFNPLGRIWEFGLGALIATASLPRLGTKLAGALSLVGFSGLGLTIAFYNPTLTFPGLPALLPALATALVIFAGRSDLPAWMNRRMAFPPVQFLGEVSYSLYLWHWPLVIIPAFVANGDLSWQARLALIAIAVTLAWLTKKFVEDPIRFAGFLSNARPRRTLLIALAASLVVSGVAQLAIWDSSYLVKANQDYNETLSLAEAKKDASDPGSKCMTKAEDSTPIYCEFGNLNSPKRVLLIGDSHAATHLGAMKQLARVNNWHLVLTYKAGCSFSLIERNNTARGTSCLAWNQNLQKHFASEPSFNLVVTANYAANRLADIEAPNWNELAVAGYRAAWKPFIARGANITVIRDNPEMTKEMAACWDTATVDASKCQMPLSRALFPDDAVVAAKGVATVADLTDVYCPNAVCPAMIEDTYVYRNKDHISGRFDGRIWRELGARLGRLGNWLE